VVANAGDERSGRSRLRLRARGRPSVEVAVPPIAPGDQRVVNATVDPSVVWTVSLDPENDVREAREDNNTFSIRGCQLAGLR
jgi:hypothetical protein